MSSREIVRTTRVRLLRRTLALSLLTLVFAGCIKRECVCPGESGFEGGTTGAQLPKGILLLGPQGTLAFELHGATEKVKLSPIAVQGQPFQQALRADILESGGSEWSVQIQTRTVAAVKKGDLLHATFYVRSIKPQESGAAETSFVFEQAEEPYSKSVTYPIRLTPEWRKVQVRFTADESYGPGEAQVIFRLGYEPESIEIGGVSVVNYEKKVAFAALPTTEGADRKILNAPLPKEPPLPIVDGGELAFDIVPSKVVRNISSFVYGINAQRAADTGTTLRRLGGNRGTVYNWELNASSAGSDWQHLNDDWPCTNMGYQNCDKPGMQYVDFALESKKSGAEAVVEVPMVDWVAADKNGPVSDAEKAPSKRYVRSFPKKKGPYTDKPDLSDDAVYQDEFVNFVVTKLGRADKGGVKFYSLDNEPALWKSTHPRVHPEPTTYKEIVLRTEALATQITAIDPSAFVLGGVMFGWSEFMSLTSAPDAKEFSQYPSYVEYWLASMAALEKKSGRRLVHALDVHWYPESRGTKRITENDTSRKTVEARLQAPRSFWDPTYQEKSWITDQWKKPIRLVPWLLELIAARYPGTRLAMTEYNFGAGDHVSGGLAQVDVLGILGREGAYIANYWGNGAGVGELPKYVASAFRLYRNYDGKGGKYGDTAVTATTPDESKASIYAATDTKNPEGLTVIVINKTQDKRYQARIALGGAPCTKAEAFVLDATSPKLQGPKPLSVEQGALRFPLEPLSAALFVCTKG
jgi:mannan endo-1,4-beta-mannosidase